MFCVECGKEGPIFRDGVCISCYLKTHSFSKGLETVDLPVCTNCGAYKYKNTWLSDLFAEVFRRVVKNTFHISKELKKVDVAIECTEKKEGIECRVIISGFLDNVEVSEEHKTMVILKKTICDICSKRYGGYHEAIVQIRGDRRKPTRVELNNIRLIVENLVENLRAKGNRGLFITDIGEEHGGLDFYISEKGAALTIAKKIQEQHGGEIKQSSKNIGMKDSKQVYRVTHLLRLPSYKKNDIISYDKSYFYISSINGNKAHVYDLSTWNERVLDRKNLQKANILGGKESIKEMILVSQSKQEVQVMNPESYEINIIKKPKPVSYKSENIKIVIIDDRFFLFPEKFKTDK